ARKRGQHNHRWNGSFPLVIVRDVTGRKYQQDHRHHLRESYQSKRERRVGAFIEFLHDRDRQHLLPQRGDETRDQVKRKIPVVAQDGIRPLGRGGASGRQRFGKRAGIHRANKAPSGSELKTVLKESGISQNALFSSASAPSEGGETVEAIPHRELDVGCSRWEISLLFGSASS